MSKKQPENYLDFIPIINQQNTWSADDAGVVTIHMVNRGFYNRLAQKVFHTPRVSHIHLDVYGSFLWQQIDGIHTVGQLALIMKQQFGDKAEPLYDRLVKYMQILHNNKFVLFQGRDKVRA